MEEARQNTAMISLATVISKPSSRGVPLALPPSPSTTNRSPLLTREKYVTQVLNNVKDTVLGKSSKNLFSFFVQNEELSDEELLEILEIIQNKIHPAP